MLVERIDAAGVTTLLLNRPDKLNALTVTMFAELRAHVEALAEYPTARCIVVRGAGRCFSAGHDLADIHEGESAPSAGWHSETLRMLEDLPQPVVAAVHGHCYTGALEVALACDFIVAADSARFADTHAKWSLTPIWGMSQRLPRRVGIAAAKRLMFSGDIIDAQEAVRIGLAEFAVPEPELAETVASLAARIANNSAFTHQANKRLLNVTDGMNIQAGLGWEVANCEGQGPDAQERIAAFTKRR